MSELLVADLLHFIDASPSPFHAVQSAAARLSAAGFREVDEGDAWSVSAGDRIYVTRDGGSLAAFVIGDAPAEAAGFRLVAAHTDSPTLRVKPNPDVRRHGYQQLAVEVYGGVLLHTWLDRDLSLAGRVWLRGPSGAETQLLDLGSDGSMNIPSLAIHLNRTVNTDGLKLNPQDHLLPLIGLEDEGAPGLVARIAERLGRPPEEVLGFELSAYALSPSRLGGLNDAFIYAPRLDNLAGCHAAVAALCQAPAGSHTTGLVLYDHEECGSQSARGARSNLLERSLRRLTARGEAADEERWARAMSRSQLISSDMAHGVHPNHADKHEPGHRPVLGKGPVLKTNVNQAYATEGGGWAQIELLARRHDLPLQHFVSRNDLACGSTVGPMTAAALGLRTIDLGNPMLSMHSAREMAAAADVAPMVTLLSAFLSEG